MLERVLVAIDGSSTAEAALGFALRLSHRYGSALVLCTALDRAAAIVATSMPNGLYPRARTQSAGERRVVANGIVVVGTPANALLDAAAAQGADLIAVGTHGRRGLRRLFLGSVAENVVRRSSLPVLVVRTPA